MTERRVVEIFFIMEEDELVEVFIRNPRFRLQDLKSTFLQDRNKSWVSYVL